MSDFTDQIAKMPIFNVKPEFIVQHHLEDMIREMSEKIAEECLLAGQSAIIMSIYIEYPTGEVMKHKGDVVSTRTLIDQRVIELYEGKK